MHDTRTSDDNEAGLEPASGPTEISDDELQKVGGGAREERGVRASKTIDLNIGYTDVDAPF